MLKYNNTKNYLNSINCVLVSTAKEFIETNNVIFSCSFNHETTLVFGTFANKKAKLTKNKIPLNEHCEIICSACAKIIEHNNIISKLETHAGLEIKNIDYKTRTAVYICKICLNEAITCISNLQKKNPTKNCEKCAHNLQKNSYSYIKQRIESYGSKINCTEEEFKDIYVNKDSPIPLICQCGSIRKRRIQDLKKHEKCKECMTVPWCFTYNR